MPFQINCPKSWTHFLFPTPQQKTPERHYTSCAIHPVCLCIGYTFPFLLIDAQLKKKVHNQGFFISHLFSFKPQKFPAVKEAQAATCIRDPITHPGHYSASLCVFFSFEQDGKDVSSDSEMKFDSNLEEERKRKLFLRIDLCRLPRPLGQWWRTVGTFDDRLFILRWVIVPLR